MNDLFRARVLEFQTQKALDSTQPLDYLIAALDSVELARALAELCRLRSGDSDDRDSDRPGQRFMNMVHRDDDVSRWVAFLRHELKRYERKREDSPWQGLESLPEKLEVWRDSLDTGSERDVVVSEVQDALVNIVEDLTREERVRIGLRAFRAMLWQLRTGGGEE